MNYLVFRALALNCNVKLNPEGAESKDWKKGRPVRVVRNCKNLKHSKYGPPEGNRYVLFNLRFFKSIYYNLIV